MMGRQCIILDIDCVLNIYIYIYIFFPTLDAGLPLGEGVRGAAAQLTYMADMGVISIEEARRRMRILYAVRASQIYGNLNHLDNDFVSYMV